MKKNQFRLSNSSLTCSPSRRLNTLTEILKNTEDDATDYRFSCQVQKCSPRTTKSQKPFYELQLVDAVESISLKIWNNHPQFDQALSLKPGQFLLVEGSFTQSKYGLESAQWSWAPLPENEKEALLSGDPSLTEKQEADYVEILRIINGINDPRLKALCVKFLEDHGKRFKRAAGARKNHHARRGGLTEHVSVMMRSAEALSGVYPNLHKDVMVTAVLLHDCGKLWENNYPETDFNQVYSFHAEALGHISLGIELVNKIWRDLFSTPEAGEWKELSPSSERVRVHLLHLIASHHGTLEYGSPVVPKTPEAFALHYIDNLDAKMEMCANAYAKAPKLSVDIYEKQFPLPSNLLSPLE